MPPKKALIIYCFFVTFIVIAKSYALTETRNYIIVFKDHAKKRAMLNKAEFASVRSFNIIPAVVNKLDSQQLAELLDNQNIAYIEPDYPVYIKGFKVNSANNDMISASSSTQSIPYGITMTGATQVWSKTKGKGAVVALLDTGINMYHPDRGSVLASKSFVTGETVEDFNEHGTHTSGTVAAADNDIGVAGVSPEVDLLIGKVLNNEGTGQVSWLISGIEWAVDNGANVITMSLGGTDNSVSLREACDNAYAEGILLVAAAGNDNTNVPEYPASYDSVISVAAVDEYKEKASFSNYGSAIDLAAPGVSVLSTVPIGNNATGEATWFDTSYSANAVEGTLAGMVSGQICNCGMATGLDAENTCPDTVAGNIAHIRRGDITFSAKVAHARSKGAIGVIISNNVSGSFFGTLNGVGSTLVVVSISQDDGDILEPLAESGISGSVSVSVSTTASFYDYFNGTSMAAPHVAGAAALIYAAQGGNISAEEVREILIESAEDLGTSGRDDLFGYGLVNVQSAFEIMQPKTCDAVWTLGYGYPSDIDRDCHAGSSDLYLLATEWLHSDCDSLNEWCGRTDIDQSNFVSFADFEVLASMWLVCNDPEDTYCISN